MYYTYNHPSLTSSTGLSTAGSLGGGNQLVIVLFSTTATTKYNNFITCNYSTGFFDLESIFIQF